MKDFNYLRFRTLGKTYYGKETGCDYMRDDNGQVVSNKAYAQGWNAAITKINNEIKKGIKG